jgi:hypothetical protein
MNLDDDKERVIQLKDRLRLQEDTINLLREEMKSREARISSLEEDLLLASDWINSTDKKLRGILESTRGEPPSF